MSQSHTTSHNAMSRRRFLRVGAASACAATTALGLAVDQTPAGSTNDGYIDAHVHVWTSDTERYPLRPGFPKSKMRRPSFTPEELFAHARPCGVTRVVLIQMSHYGYDNSYMLDAMKAHPGVFSGVAVIDRDQNPRAHMLDLADQGVRGFRISAGRRPADRWLDGDGMAAMWKCGAERGLAMCPLIDPRHLPAVDRMCRRFPDTPVVIDHFARIGIDGQFRTADLDTLCSLAQHKNVHVKASAFCSLGKRTAPYLDTAPMIRRVLDAFGPERLMWATDGPWQVMGGHTYKNSIDLFRTRLDFLTNNDRQQILRKTAERVFFS